MKPLLPFVCAVVLTGCATVITGYTSRVDLHTSPDSLSVSTAEGVELPRSCERMKSIQVPINATTSYVSEAIDSSWVTIHLRSNRDHVLIVKKGDRLHRIEVDAKLSGWWFALDLVCGGIPAVVDAITGNWNYFDAVELR